MTLGSLPAALRDAVVDDEVFELRPDYGALLIVAFGFGWTCRCNKSSDRSREPAQSEAVAAGGATSTSAFTAGERAYQRPAAHGRGRLLVIGDYACIASTCAREAPTRTGSDQLLRRGGVRVPSGDPRRPRGQGRVAPHPARPHPARGGSRPRRGRRAPVRTHASWHQRTSSSHPRGPRQVQVRRSQPRRSSVRVSAALDERGGLHDGGSSHAAAPTARTARRVAWSPNPPRRPVATGCPSAPGLDARRGRDALGPGRVRALDTPVRHGRTGGRRVASAHGRGSSSCDGTASRTGLTRFDVGAVLALGIATGMVTVAFLSAIERIPLGTAVASSSSGRSAWRCSTGRTRGASSGPRWRSPVSSSSPSRGWARSIASV